jgi:hypothetical protein
VENPNLLLSRIEAAHLWAYFHKDWLLEIRTLLRPQLPPHYHVFVESEAILVSPDAAEIPTPVMPDLAVASAERNHPAGARSSAQEGTAAVIELDEAYEVVSKYSLLIRRSPENEVVAALELLSPSNKGIGSRLGASFRESGVNFLEIDALTEGERAIPAGLTRLATFERNAWTAAFQAGRRRLRGWGWNVADPLPQIPWTIDEGQRVLVDLPAAFQAACEFNRWEQLA